jgi:hypothetical protein
MGRVMSRPAMGYDVFISYAHGRDAQSATG